jgi:hypothetical protein
MWHFWSWREQEVRQKWRGEPVHTNNKTELFLENEKLIGAECSINAPES